MVENVEIGLYKKKNRKKATRCIFLSLKRGHWIVRTAWFQTEERENGNIEGWGDSKGACSHVCICYCLSWIAVCS